jgi:5-methylcytosine-specific restriction endonuclease McrA
VVALKKFVKPRIRLRYNRPNVLGRDQYVCCYCGSSPKHGNGKPDTSKLTIDHVIPRAQSKNAKVVSCVTGQLIPVTCWGNVVTACKDCNGQKADQTPTQAGMPLRYLPRTPDAWDVLRASLRKVHVPEIWLPYLPDNVR